MKGPRRALMPPERTDPLGRPQLVAQWEKGQDNEMHQSFHDSALRLLVGLVESMVGKPKVLFLGACRTYLIRQESF